MFKILIVLKKLILWTMTSFTNHLRFFFAEIYLCELDVLLAFHYMIFKSELELSIK